ncbi:MAG: hypothetical protein NTV56_20330, partial [Alphaproteobacteria bacterium]|nr:hypothetical protein [Alphaproteobacteria bacterium]
IGIVIVVLSLPFKKYGGGYQYGVQKTFYFLTRTIFEPSIMFRNHDDSNNQVWFYIGAMSFMFGLFHSFLYVGTVGKIYSWIKNR